MIHKRSVRDAVGGTSVLTIPTEIITQRGGVLIDEQQGFVVVDVPRAAVRALRTDLADTALGIQERDDFELLGFLSYPIDVREPIPAYPAAYARSVALSGGARDAFVLQFQSLPHPEWLAALRDAGVSIIDYIPENAYTVLAQPAVISGLAARLPVQLLRLHQPVHKVASSLRTATTEWVDVTAAVHKSPEGDLAREYLKGITLAEIRPPSELADRTFLRVTVLRDGLAQLTALPGTIWVEPLLTASPSGEREVAVGTGNAAFFWDDSLGRAVFRPGSQNSHSGWLAARGINPETVEPIGMLDTGWHFGAGSVHNDLRTNTGTNTVTALNYCAIDHDPDTDCSGHGTMVAGVIGGNASGPYGSQIRDSGGAGYYMGLGIVPGAPIISGRIWSLTVPSNFYFQPKSWTDTIYPELSGLGVRITNNSWNWTSTDGTAVTYMNDSYELDQLVRHAGSSDTYPAMTIVFSGGNQEEAAGGSLQTTAPANGKNVIAVGATQNWNLNAYPELLPGTAGANARDANAIWSGSRVGPTWGEGRLKPDVVAVGTAIESARTEFVGACVYDPYPAVGSTIDPGGPVNSRHLWSRGTSFSSPLVAGASALLRASQGPISPAMTKAMLIGLATPLNYQDHAPKSESGWGRLNLNQLHAPNQPGYYSVDQAVVMSPGSAFFVTNDLSQLDPARPVRIVLAWTDAPGTPGTATRQLRNNLDLVVYSRQYFGMFSVGNTFDAPSPYNQGLSSVFGLGRFPSAYDNLNNVEVVVVPPDIGSTFWIEVRNTGIIQNGLSRNPGSWPAQQDFALFVENVH